MLQFHLLLGDLCLADKDEKIIGGIKLTADDFCDSSAASGVGIRTINSESSSFNFGCRLHAVLSVYLCRLSHLTEDALVMTVPVFSFI